MNKKILFIIILILAPLVLLPLISFFTDTLYMKYWDSKSELKQTNQSQTITKHTVEAQSKNAYSVDGFDWSLPENTPTSTNSGLIGVYDNGLDFAQNIFSIVRWDDANPQKGRYDFSKFEKSLDDMSPKKSLVRLEVNSICETPKWAKKSLRSSADKSLIFWDDAYIELLKPFINEFSKRYANDPRIIGVQLGIGDGEYRKNSCDFSDKDGWGEFWMTPESIAIAQNKYGFTPEVFEKYSKKIIDIYSNAFINNRGKLAFTNIGPTFSWTDIATPYNKKLRGIAQYVRKAGIGNRDGNIELWMRYIDKAYGVQLHSLPDSSCFLDYDEAYASETGERYFGTENEFYGNKNYVIDTNGPYKNQPYRFMVSSLRALQMRRNYISIADDSMARLRDPRYKTQDFLKYLNKVLGKKIEDTADVFIVLGERYVAPSNLVQFANEPCVKNAKKGAPIRSFGRWLKEKSNSKPALKISMPASENYWGQNYYMPHGVDYEYSARLGNKFEFDINDRVIKTHCENQNQNQNQKKCNVEIKITYKDTVKTSLNIQYGDSNDNKYQTFQSNGDNKIKTVSFTVNSRFQNKQMGSDFTITSQNPLPLIMIRVNFL